MSGLSRLGGCPLVCGLPASLLLPPEREPPRGPVLPRPAALLAPACQAPWGPIAILFLLRLML